MNNLIQNPSHILARLSTSISDLQSAIGYHTAWLLNYQSTITSGFACPANAESMAVTISDHCRLLTKTIYDRCATTTSRLNVNCHDTAIIEVTQYDVLKSCGVDDSSSASSAMDRYPSLSMTCRYNVSFAAGEYQILDPKIDTLSKPADTVHANRLVKHSTEVRCQSRAEDGSKTDEERWDNYEIEPYENNYSNNGTNKSLLSKEKELDYSVSSLLGKNDSTDDLHKTKNPSSQDISTKTTSPVIGHQRLLPDIDQKTRHLYISCQKVRLIGIESLNSLVKTKGKLFANGAEAFLENTTIESLDISPTTKNSTEAFLRIEQNKHGYSNFHDQVVNFIRFKEMSSLYFMKDGTMLYENDARLGRLVKLSCKWDTVNLTKPGDQLECSLGRYALVEDSVYFIDSKRRVCSIDLLKVSETHMSKVHKMRPAVCFEGSVVDLQYKNKKVSILTEIGILHMYSKYKIDKLSSHSQYSIPELFKVDLPDDAQFTCTLSSKRETVVSCFSSSRKQLWFFVLDYLMHPQTNFTFKDQKSHTTCLRLISKRFYSLFSAITSDGTLFILKCSQQGEIEIALSNLKALSCQVEGLTVLNDQTLMLYGMDQAVILRIEHKLEEAIKESN